MQALATDIEYRTYEDATFLDDDGCTYTADGKTLLSCPPDLASCTVRPGCTTIADRAFEHRIKLACVTLPDSVERIGSFAFYATRISSFTAPAKLRMLGTKAFFNCKQLEACTLNDQLQEIGDEAFAGTAVSSLELPASLSYLGHGFLNRSRLAQGTDLSRLTLDNENAKYALDGQGGIYVRRGEGAVLCEFFGENASSHSVMPGTWRVACNAYRNKDKLQRVALPEGLRELGKGAFQQCGQLTQVDIPESLEVIGPDAFHATALESLYIPKNLERIGLCALTACKTRGGVANVLQRVKVHPENKRFAYRDGLLLERHEDGERLLWCSPLQPSVTIPRSVTQIGPYALSGASQVGTLTLHDSFTRVHRFAFVMERPVFHVRVQLAQPVDGRSTVDAYFPPQTSKATFFSEAFFSTPKAWRIAPSRGGARPGLAGVHRAAGGLAQDKGSYRASKPGTPIPEDQLLNSSAFAFNEYEDGIDVAMLCAVADRAVAALYGDLNLFARIALIRLDQRAHLGKAHRSTFLKMLDGKIVGIVKASAEKGDAELLEELVRRGYINADNIAACIECANAAGDVASSSLLLELKRKHFGQPVFDFEI